MHTETIWWYWRPVQDRLVSFGQALLAPLGRRYRITIKPGRSFCAPEHAWIQVDPQSFPDEPPRVQFEATEGVVVHEAGHALFSDAWPDQEENVLQKMSNILEDERAERAMRQLYPGVAGVLDLRCRLRLSQALANEPDAAPEWQAFNTALVWRWARRCKMSQAKMLAALRCGPRAARFWRKIRPLVEQAWDAPDTATVIELARRILEILGIPPEQAETPLVLLLDPGDGIPVRRTDSPLPRPEGPTTARQPAPPEPGAEVDLKPGGDAFTEPEPYEAVETEARRLAGEMAEALKLPEPEVRLRPDEWRGRYSFRQ